VAPTAVIGSWQGSVPPGNAINQQTSAYDDVIISGGTLAIATSPLTPTDAGKIFGKLVGKLETNFNGWSTYVEGELRGTSNVFVVGARVGARYSFN
jgi:hypothetical protein